MTTAFLDPNYDPTRFYSLVEPLLLLFPRVYIYAPNAAAMDRAHAESESTLTKEDLVQYAKRGLVVPIAGSRYWDPAHRAERRKGILSNARATALSAARAELFAWTQFDEQIAALAVREDRMYDVANWYKELPQRSPETCAALWQRIAPLYQMKRLPQEFYEDEYTNRSPEYICGQVLHHFFGDAAICGLNGIAHRVLSAQYQPLANALAEIAARSPSILPSGAQPSQTTNVDIALTGEDFRIALDFAKALATSRDLSAVLPEYHQSQFSRAFSQWVTDVLQQARSHGRALDRALIERFNRDARSSSAQEEKTSKRAGEILGGGLGAVAALGSDPRMHEIFNLLLTGRVTRRNLFKALIVGGGVCTAIGVGTAIGGEIGEKVPSLVTKLRDQRWTDLIVRAPKRGLE